MENLATAVKRKKTKITIGLGFLPDCSSNHAPPYYFKPVAQLKNTNSLKKDEIVPRQVSKVKETRPNDFYNVFIRVIVTMWKTFGFINFIILSLA